jgi:hypothetical protein
VKFGCEGLQLASKIDDVAIAVFPLIENFEI